MTKTNDPYSQELQRVANGPRGVDALFHALESLRAQITALRANEATLEGLIVEHVGAEQEGPRKTETEHYRVTTTGRISRALDPQAVVALRELIPAPVFDCVFTFKPTLNTRNYKDLANTHPEVISLVDRAVTTKPGKTTVKIERRPCIPAGASA